MSLTRSQSLEAALLANAAVAALVEARIYPLVAIPPAGKSILVYKMEADFQYALSGLNRVDVQLEIKSWASDYDAAHALSDAVRALLTPAGSPSGFNGLLGGAGGIKVIHCCIDKETEAMVAISPDQFVFEVCSYYALKHLV